MLHCRSWMSRTTSCFQQHTWTLFASHYVISLERYFFQAGKPPGLRLDRTALLFTSLRPSLTWCGRIENTWLWSCRWSQGSRRATIAGRRKESIYSVESCCCSFFRLPSSLSCSRLSHNWHDLHCCHDDDANLWQKTQFCVIWQVSWKQGWFLSLYDHVQSFWLHLIYFYWYHICSVIWLV